MMGGFLLYRTLLEGRLFRLARDAQVGKMQVAGPYYFWEIGRGPVADWQPQDRADRN